MTSVDLLRTCLVSACANTLFNTRDSNPLVLHKADVVARRTTRLRVPPSPYPSLRSHRSRHSLRPAGTGTAAAAATGTTTAVVGVSAATAARRRRSPWSAQYHAYTALLRKPPRSLSLPRLPAAPRRSETAALPAPQETREKAIQPPSTPKRPPTTPRRHHRLPSYDMDEMVLLQRSLDESRRNGASTPEEQLQQRRHPGRGGSRDDARPRRFPDEPLASPASHIDDLIETRSSRSASTTSRSTHRLSLTLPIMPAHAYSARPTPATSTATSFPPTPLDTPALMSPVDANDLITAIAAQERRVLELKEELSRAESDLGRLKKQWATHEAYKKRAPPRRTAELIPGLGPAAELHDEATVQRTAEIDRRKALLEQQSQLNQQATPDKSRRRVFTGGHTRTLSLLSPTRPTGPFPGNDDESDGARPEPDARFAPAAFSQHNKRASWTSRSAQATGVKQLAEDLKTGIWTFMEDLRQATVGDEPITGQGSYMRGMDGNMRPTVGGSDQDTIRARGSTARPRVPSTFDEASKALVASKQQQQQQADNSPDLLDGGEGNPTSPRPPLPLRRSKTDAGARGATKRFSWTPLTIDSYDDNDWSNWDSPGVSSPRWSGTTVNGDIIPSIPEKRADDEASPL